MRNLQLKNLEALERGLFCLGFHGVLIKSILMKKSLIIFSLLNIVVSMSYASIFSMTKDEHESKIKALISELDGSDMESLEFLDYNIVKDKNRAYFTDGHSDTTHILKIIEDVNELEAVEDFYYYKDSKNIYLRANCSLNVLREKGSDKYELLGYTKETYRSSGLYFTLLKINLKGKDFSFERDYEDMVKTHHCYP